MRFLALLPLAFVSIVACSEKDKATPQVILNDARLEGSNATCRDSGDLFKVGDPGNVNADPPSGSVAIKDGDAFDQGTASVDCSVTSSGTDEFQVNATVLLTGATGGLFKIDGKFKTTGTQDNIHVIVSSKKSGNQYEDRGCTVDYETSYRGVAPGRVWGIVTCENATNAGAQTVCKAVAEFRFENCAQ